MKLIKTHKIELLLLFLIIAGYFILRLPNLTLQPIFADEAIYIRWAQIMRSEQTLRFLPLSDGKTPLFMWTMIPLFKVFSNPLFAGRFVSVISGLVTLAGVFLLARKVFGLKTALWASLLYAITPYTVFFDRMALVDSMLASFSIWSLYFALWLIRSLRLDLSMILGFLLGAALLTKTPATMNLLILPIALLGLKRNNQGKYPIVKAVGFLAISVFIAFGIYNLLRLGPNFHLLSSRNQDYIFSPLELIGRPLDPFIPHFHDIADWFPKLFTLPILILIGIGVYHLLFSLNKLGLIMIGWALIPLIIQMIFLKTFTARYLLSAIAPLLIFGGLGINKALDRVRIDSFFSPGYKGSFFKIMIVLIAIMPLALKFDYQLIKNPPPNSLPAEERRGYFEDWTAGYGLSDIADFLKEERKKGKVVVGTEGFFGTLPDGLYIYLDKDNIAVVGSSASVSAQIRSAAKENLTYFVGNKKNFKNGIEKAEQVKEYPKVKPLDGSMQDAMVLYKILP
ncbi:glycosyltransferase family 39 protein [Candidatus Daviesbacteria bacterium]|nr:glycosyltransferase family 39 protein [Candidatus Daviesbacteria bacterium]